MSQVGYYGWVDGMNFNVGHRGGNRGRKDWWDRKGQVLRGRRGCVVS